MTHPIASIETFSYHNLNKELEVAKDKKEFFESLLKAYNDDYWQRGQGSLLPPPKAGSDVGTLNSLLEKRFVFRNVVRECMERASGAFYGKSPNWGLSDKKNTEVAKALGEFWTRENLGTVLSKAFESRLTVGRGGLRIYIPSKYRREAVVVANPDLEGVPDPKTKTPERPKEYIQFSSVEEALKAIKVEYVSPESAKLLDDEGELFSIVRYSERRNWEDTKDTNVIEFSFVDDKNLTFIGKVVENETAGTVLQADLSSGMDLGGLTTFIEFKGEPYATKALYKNNQLLNLALTCAGFSLVDNGFGETFFTNVDVEMERVPDTDTELGYRLVPKQMVRGGGVTQNLIGIAQENPETGQETRMTPGVTFREPSSVQAFKDGKDMAYTACLEETGQLYAKISGDAVASGESRIQAMTDFWLRIRKYKPEVDEQGSWALTAILKFAAALAGKATEYNGVFATYDSKIFIGQISSAERQIVLDMKKEGVISRDTAQVLLGVEDPELEKERVQSEMKEAPTKAPVAEFDRRMDVAMKMSGVFDQNYILNYLGVTNKTEQDKIIAALAANTAAQNAALIDTQDGIIGNSEQPTEAPEDNLNSDQ